MKRSAPTPSRSSGSTPTPRRCRLGRARCRRSRRRRAGVLVGTQMVAKGHDFPDVSLGVVIDADQTLRFPDFRSEERTFALVTQLAGRTGRGAAAGAGDRIGSRVLVQTLAPDARSLRFAARHDADGFVADELRRRRALRYPPFASLIRVVCSAEAEPEAGGAAAADPRADRRRRRRRARPGAAVSAAREVPQPGIRQGDRPRARDRGRRPGGRCCRPGNRQTRRVGQRRRRSGMKASTSPCGALDLDLYG